MILVIHHERNLLWIVLSFWQWFIITRMSINMLAPKSMSASSMISTSSPRPWDGGSNVSNDDADVQSTLRAVGSATMSNVWSKTACSYQTDAVTYLSQMSPKGQKPSPFLLIQRTGSSKSTVSQTVGFVTRGVSIVLQNTLSIGADWQSKSCKPNQDNKPA